MSEEADANENPPSPPEEEKPEEKPEDSPPPEATPPPTEEAPPQEEQAPPAPDVPVAAVTEKSSITEKPPDAPSETTTETVPPVEQPEKPPPEPEEPSIEPSQRRSSQLSDKKIGSVVSIREEDDAKKDRQESKVSLPKKASEHKTTPLAEGLLTDERKISIQTSKEVIGPAVPSIAEKRRSSIRKSADMTAKPCKVQSSKAKIALGSVIDIRRFSQTGEFMDRKGGARYMNTYKLEPDRPFNVEKVEKVLENVMTEALENMVYDPEKCPRKAKWASMTIRTKIKELDFDRYKLLCLVTIGEKKSQDLLATCRFLWDAEKDRYATFSLENTYVFGFAQCFGIYYE